MTHGGDIYFEGGEKVLDFSANISPLGLPAGVAEAVRRGLESCGAYPDPLCRTLRSALAEHCQVEASRIVCGNGAADLIYRIVTALRPGNALVTAPAFSEYEKALKERNAEVTHYALDPPYFRLEKAFIQRIRSETDILFLCNPNNPTGVLIDPSLLQEVSLRCAETGTLLVMDECFNEFLDEPAAHSLKGLLGDMKNLIILKAFTKVYGMAGFRLGYCLCGSVEVARAIAGAGQAWPVSGIAQIAGLAALNERDYVEKLRRLIARERRRMQAELSAMGFEVLGGSANYLFFRVDTAGFDAGPFYSALLDRGILARNCAGFPGLDNRYCRIAIRTQPENQVLLETLQSMKSEV
ncbi:MAG: aminotransferase class I/II-fold pyridoxal phosphate-dependent enzyme [Spirochaetaceae bacterium]|jgi:threonine-phosphate decarboxylase|nr:aminotransferase class I/II-fold pyridoxal phosphate-dependent enzyme [Spirochaetaceae bacterium]